MTGHVDTTEFQVRIGDIAEASGAATCLVTVGLGSCVGVALIEQRSGAAALAHVFLPEPPLTGLREGAGPGTYADRAVPDLVRRVTALAGDAAARPRLVAVIAGGARMFSGRSGADIGERNVEAVRTALEQLGVRIAVADVGGSKGRTMRVRCGVDASVTVREVGSAEREIWRAAERSPAGDEREATAPPSAAAA